MKKKNLIILLLIPFVIALLSIVTINATFSTFNSDITSIEWEYEEVEAFKADQSYELNARGVTTSSVPLAPGNDLVWKVENKDPNIIEAIAEILYENGKYYLVPKTNGEVIVTCSNEKGNIFKKMTVVLYTDGAILVRPVVANSQNNIDSSIYYGEYDWNDAITAKERATIDFTLTCYPSNLLSTVEFLNVTNNINIIESGDKFQVKIADNLNELAASFTVKSNVYENVIPVTFDFKIVKDGINVYTYNELLACTNKSEKGEIAVLRKSFESERTVNSSLTASNITLFGNKKNSTFNFANEVYQFNTTYNNEYIKQWNKFAKENPKYDEVSSAVMVGLRVQKDFYGNGFTINMHNLTYPSQRIPSTVDGKEVYIPTLGRSDLFRGPKPFYTLGDPNGLPLVSAYGQDNIGFYVDGSNITINDVNLKNCDTVDSLSFFETVGTVLEVNGRNIKITNSRLSNGKNILRSFSSDLTIDNSMLSQSMNFLITTGSNEYIDVNEAISFNFINQNGSTNRTSIKNYLDVNSTTNGNGVLNDYLKGSYTDREAIKKSLISIQDGLNSEQSIVEGNFKGNMVINDTYFYNSGLAAIALETLFNGPFLYSTAPSEITDLFNTAGSMIDKTIVPYTPTKVSGISYPVKVEIGGKTKFFDYKVANEISLNGLIDENISTMVSDVLGSEVNITIDHIFPLKSMLIADARSKNCTYSSDGKEYMNLPVAFYGGGVNLSEVNFTSEDLQDLGTIIEVDFLDNYLNLTGNEDLLQRMQNMMLKSVTVVTGFEPFKFICVKGNGYLFGENPNVSDLIANAIGE